MALATPFAIAFLALIMWRFVFANLRRRPSTRTNAAPQQRQSNVLGQILRVLGQSCEGVNAQNGFDMGADRIYPIDARNRAEMYLHRIIALTGVTQTSNVYVLDVGKTRFHVRHRYIRRLRDAADGKCAYEETCFYPVHKGMPGAEEIATALLQLANNPTLFDKWAAHRDLPFKSDGEAFQPRTRIGST
jgi:hypothetical protein